MLLVSSSTNRLTVKHENIGEHWNRKFIRAIQAVLNSTKGKVGPGVEFFEEAFGSDIDEFHRILWMPESCIVFRRKHDAELRKRLANKYTDSTGDDDDMANEWWRDFCALPSDKLEVAKSIISKNRFTNGDYNCNDPSVLRVLGYYTIAK